MIGRWTRVRMVLCGLVLAGLAGRVVHKAVQVQLHEGARLKEMAEKNYLKEIEIAPRRGRVLDHIGAELASTVEFDSIFCNPRQLVHVPDAARKLAKALGTDSRELQKIIEKKSYFAWLKRRATPAQSEAVMALKLTGVRIEKEPGRVYPNGEVASTLLGHASVDGRGLDGVELAWDKYLRGAGVRALGLRDSIGRELLVGGMIDSAAADGQDLVLSVDKYLTYVTETALARAIEKHNAKAAMGIVMDPRTGEVLVMTNLPGYDPSDPRDAVLRGAKNRAIVDEFEPGSTMKTFTFAAVLEAGGVKPTDLYECQMGQMKVGKYTIKDDHPKGMLTAADVLKYSSNIGTYKIARKIGREKLRESLVQFGFGRRTGVGLLGERSGTLHPASRWGEIGFATHSFGQGMTVTALQLAAGFSAVASGGIYRPPRLALRVVKPDGRKEELAPASGERRVISAETARTLLHMMRGVTEGGTAKQAAMDGYPVAGKTGTAQKVTAGGGYGDKRVSSFVGIVPADNPRLVIVVVIDEPAVKIKYGGVVAAPAFKEIAEAALPYLGVAPTMPLAPKKGPARVPTEEDAKEGPGSDVAPTEIEDVVADAPEPQDPEVGAPVLDLVVMPDFTGLSIGEAVRAARRAGVEILPEGSGVGAGQTPGPGRIARGSVCRVSFRPGG